MTELRSTATSHILLPMKLRHSLVREAVHLPSRGSPGLRAGSVLPGKDARVVVREPETDLRHLFAYSKIASVRIDKL